MLQVGLLPSVNRDVTIHPAKLWCASSACRFLLYAKIQASLCCGASPSNRRSSSMQLFWPLITRSPGLLGEKISLMLFPIFAEIPAPGTVEAESSWPKGGSQCSTQQAGGKRKGRRAGAVVKLKCVFLFQRACAHPYCSEGPMHMGCCFR